MGTNVLRLPAATVRLLAWIAIAAVVAVVVLGVPSSPALGATITLQQSVPISLGDPDFQGTSDDCAGTPAGATVLHFVLVQTTDTSGFITATFNNGSVGPQANDPSSSRNLHFFVTAPAGATTLTGATVDADNGRLVLSHICGGGTTTTTTTTTGTTTTTSP